MRHKDHYILMLKTYVLMYLYCTDGYKIKQIFPIFYSARKPLSLLHSETYSNNINKHIENITMTLKLDEVL